MRDMVGYAMAMDGIKIHYEVEGSGEPIVMLHGFSMTLRRFDQAGLVEGLKDSYCLVLLDARGHGQSDKPYDVEAHSIEKRAGDVIAVLDALDIAQAHVWGYSMGGKTAWEVGRSYPERARSLVIGGMHGEAHTDPQKQAILGRVDAMDSMDPEAILSSLVAELADAQSMDGKAMVEQGLLSTDFKALSASMRAQVEWRGVVEDLPRLQMPVLVYCGDADPRHDRAKANALALPKGEFASLPGFDHIQVGNRGNLVLPIVLPFLERVRS